MYNIIIFDNEWLLCMIQIKTIIIGNSFHFAIMIVKKIR